MRVRRYRPAAVLMMGLHLSACTTWRPTPMTPRQAIEGERPERVRITNLDGSRVVVESPGVRGDSITGLLTSSAGECREIPSANGETICVRDTQQRAVARLSDVQMMEVRRTSAVRAVAAIVLVPVAVIAGIALLTVSSEATGEGPF